MVMVRLVVCYLWPPEPPAPATGLPPGMEAAARDMRKSVFTLLHMSYEHSHTHTHTHTHKQTPKDTTREHCESVREGER